MTVFIPKGEMCMTCEFLYADCSALLFTKMKPLVTYPDENITIVRCTSYGKESIQQTRDTFVPYMYGASRHELQRLTKT